MSIRASEEAGERPPQAQAGRSAAADTSSPVVARIPELDLGRLAGRIQRDAAGELFHALSWAGLAAEEVRRNAPPPPPPPQAPPLPFTFMGKLIDANEVTVFLTNGIQNWVVGAGDTIEAAYRVDAIGDRVMTLTYLALGQQQALAIGEGAASPEPSGALSASEALPAAPQRTTPLPGQVPLLLAGPSRAAAGAELIVQLGLPAGGPARKARVELAYDATVLAALGASGPDSGRMAIELGGNRAPVAEVRFRVISQSPTTTRIGIARAAATDAHGASLSLATPDAHSVAIVKAGG